jgi:hypothetical protein
MPSSRSLGKPPLRVDAGELEAWLEARHLSTKGTEQ